MMSMFNIRCVLTIFLYSTIKADEILDLTVFVPTPIVDVEASSEESTFGGYTGGSDQTTDISLGRESDTGTGLSGRPVTWSDDDTGGTTPVGSGTMFPDGSTVERKDISTFDALWVSIAEDSGHKKVGAFFATASKNSRSQKIAFIILSKSAEIVPSQRSISVSIGDDVTLNVTSRFSNSSGFRWKLNNNDLSQGDDSYSLTITNIRPTDAGIYECYKDVRNGKHAIMRLTVRGCPTRKYGPNCDLNCPVCYNGGVCDHVTGLCVCPSGFKGGDCSEGCGNNHWGRTCSLICSSRGDCEGNMFCSPDPVGCACIAGFHGDTCTDTCTGSMYGSDCNQECHCNSGCDNAKGCSSGGTCKNGFTGDKCLDHESCPNGTFGEFCQYTCHCATSSSCDKDTGYCNGDCADGWGGNDCQIALPILSSSPNVMYVANEAIRVNWNAWDSSSDYGTGPVDKYVVQYRTPVNSGSEFTSAGTVDGSSTALEFEIQNLSPRSDYEIRIQVVKSVSNEGDLFSFSPITISSTSGEDTVMDLTLFCPTPSAGSDITKFAGYIPNTNVESESMKLGRRSNTGSGLSGREVTFDDVGTISVDDTMFPVGSKVTDTSQSTRTSLLIEIPGSTDGGNIGVFYTIGSNGNKYADITGLILKSDATITPERRTWTAGLGDDISLPMIATDSNGVRWRHNGSKVITDWSNKLVGTLSNIRKENGGTYECYSDDNNRKDGKHGITFLIVRGIGKT